MTIDLHYKCGLVLFCSSVTGCLLPFQKKFDLTPVRPLSTGIIFGVAICHLLPDAGEVLDTLQVTNWIMATTGLQGTVGDNGLYARLPVAEALCCLGVFVMLVIDQAIPCPHHQIQNMEPSPPGSPKSSSNSTKSNCSSSSNNTNEEITTTQTNETTRLVPSGNANGHAPGGGCCGGHGKPATSTNSIVDFAASGIPKLPNAKVYATEVAIAIHSIIIGFTMGVNPNTDSLIGFTVAMVFHQMFEGIALAMIAKQASLSARGLLTLIGVFASSLPTGIAIGLACYKIAHAAAGGDDADRAPGDGVSTFTLFFQGVPNAVSSGMLLHIGFELMMEDFNHHTKSEKFPLSKVSLAFVGGAAMVFLTVWA